MFSSIFKLFIVISGKLGCIIISIIIIIIIVVVVVVVAFLNFGIVILVLDNESVEDVFKI
jgi:hypothetical protein